MVEDVVLYFCAIWTRRETHNKDISFYPFAVFCENNRPCKFNLEEKNYEVQKKYKVCPGWNNFKTELYFYS